LREAYIQIRQGETQLQLDLREPEEAVRLLVHFTMKHFWNNPWFISMLNTENLLGGETISELDDVNDIQSILLKRVQEILERGWKENVFLVKISAVDLYIMIASVCWFPISNMHTLRAVFQVPIDENWLDEHAEKSANMILSYLRDSAAAART